MSKKSSPLYRLSVTLLMAWLVLVQPGAALAQEAVNAAGNPTGPTVPTGAPECTGAGCHQGENQGLNQGENQGLNQGASTETNVTAANSNTGANSNNSAGLNATNSSNTAVNNQATDTTAGVATGTTGDNASSNNSANASVTSGNAGIGVTQVKNDNSTVTGGSAGLSVQGHNGDYNGDLTLGAGSDTADLSSGNSVRATNNTTGADSTNTVGVSTTTENMTEVQNDGRINNLLDLAAVTGQNRTNENTGNGEITTGDADVAATLVNLLNTTVTNGNLWVTVSDIFGNLNGNIILPELAQLAAAALGGNTTISAGNNTTGADSTNTVDVGLRDTETTRVNNDADINTTVNANAITGQNEAMMNTGGGEIKTGDGSVSASSISLANTTIEGGNWALIVINALNGWLGFLVNDVGDVRALSQEETIHQIEANNQNTGAGSDNTIDVDVANNRTTTVDNDAEINNTVNASAITGQNEASRNTGKGTITTGDASVSATAVNLANTTVKDGSLFIAVVNIFGDWFGDLLYGGRSLLATAATHPTVTVDAANTDTGANSDNTVNVDVERSKTTTIDNHARLNTTLNANVDTGSNHTNRNTLAGSIQTGNGFLGLHSRAVANTTGITLDAPLSLGVNGANDTTGFNSRNRINAQLNDERIININNDANVSTIIGALANTGNNESHENTGGALIVTGSAAADVSIQNMVNKVLFALAHGGAAPGTVEADLINRLTGALSLNSNDVEATYNTLIDILNRGMVNNLVDILLNTGGNAAEQNTGHTAISTGEVCINGEIKNDLNTVKGATKTGGTVTIDQQGTINNNANLNGTTGNNTMDRNTQGASAQQAGECPKIAQAPTPTPSVPGPSGQGGGEHGQNGGMGGGEITEEKAPHVAGVTTHNNQNPSMIRSSGKLHRFPVAGGESLAQLLPGRDGINWPLFAMTSAVLIGLAWRMDRRSKLLPVRVSL